MKVEWARLSEQHFCYSIPDELGLRGFWPVRKFGHHWMYRCPISGHEGLDPAFSVDTGEQTWECPSCGRAGNMIDLVMLLDSVGAEAAKGILEDTVCHLHRLQRRAPDGAESPPTAVAVKAVTPLQSGGDERSHGSSDEPTDKPSLEALCEANNLERAFLEALGCADTKADSQPAISVPYYDQTGKTVAVRRWLSLDGQQCRWRRSDKPQPYGLDRLARAREAGWVLIVRGEADCWACWMHGVPALGLPDATTWTRKWAENLAGLEVYACDAGLTRGLLRKMAADLPGLKVVNMPDAVVSVSEAHAAGIGVADLVDGLRSSAREGAELLNPGCEYSVDEVRAQAKRVLEADDQLELVRDALREQGYGGDLKVPLVAYIGCTGRVLALSVGAMPAHLLLLGSASSGKSWTEKVVLRLMPPEAYHKIPASSPKVLIYDDASLEYRVVIFGEADSLPAGEDNPAASAMRNLLQDHHLHYDVTIKDPETGDFVVRHIRKPGPTTLLTTSVRRLGDQLDTRFFIVEVPDDHAQIAGALRMTARLELQGGPPEPDPGLVAYQLYLQLKAPWDVVVPFADQLAEHLAAQPVEGRVTRDYPRLLTMIKSVTVLRHEHRKRDADGRLVAEADDYAAVYGLIGDVYKSSSTGAGEKVRAVVRAVDELQKIQRETITVTAVSQHLGQTKMAASRGVKEALKAGWLTNSETRRGYPYHLGLGEPLPPETGLLPPSELKL
jgi:hypothetical protein